jgi:isocitrate dehydrogenase
LYLALYWAQALAAQDADKELQAVFVPVAKQLAENEQAIVGELIKVQGAAVDLGGYYRPDPVKAVQVMRPSAAFNAVIDGLL